MNTGKNSYFGVQHIVVSQSRITFLALSNNVFLDAQLYTPVNVRIYETNQLVRTASSLQGQRRCTADANPRSYPH